MKRSKGVGMREPDQDGSYEKKNDLNYEIELAERIAKKKNWYYQKLEKFDLVDIRFYDDTRTTGFLEVRRRNNPHDKHPYTIVSESKWNHMVLLSMALNVPVIFAVWFDDGIYTVDVATHGPYEIAWSNGRGNCSSSRQTDYEKVIKLFACKMKRSFKSIKEPSRILSLEGDKDRLLSEKG